MKVTDYHRNKVALYYKILIDRFGETQTLKYIRTYFRNIVWTEQGFSLIEKHLKRR